MMSIADDLSKLEELRRTGALSEAEFAKAKAALLNESPGGPEAQLGEHLAAELAEVRYQNELARIDREWEIERQQYLLSDRYGHTHVPTAGQSIGAAIAIGIFGIFWTIMAVSLTASAPDVGPFFIAKLIFPLFGVVFTVGGVALGVYAYSKAQKYQQAFQAYQARRKRATGA
jgi:hypothetical protein